MTVAQLAKQIADEMLADKECTLTNEDAMLVALEIIQDECKYLATFYE